MTGLTDDPFTRVNPLRTVPSLFKTPGKQEKSATLLSSIRHCGRIVYISVVVHAQARKFEILSSK